MSTALSGLSEVFRLDAAHVDLSLIRGFADTDRALSALGPSTASTLSHGLPGTALLLAALGPAGPSFARAAEHHWNRLRTPRRRGGRRNPQRTRRTRRIPDHRQRLPAPHPVHRPGPGRVLAHGPRPGACPPAAAPRQRADRHSVGRLRHHQRTVRHRPGPPRLRCGSGRQSAESLSGVPSPTVSGGETRPADWSSVWSAPCGSIAAAQRSAQRSRGFRAWRASCPSGVSS